MDNDWVKVLAVSLFGIAGLVVMFQFIDTSQDIPGRESKGGGDSALGALGLGGSSSNKIPINCKSFKKECPDFRGVTQKPCNELKQQVENAECKNELKQIFKCSIPMCADGMVTQNVMGEECGGDINNLIDCLHRSEMKASKQGDATANSDDADASSK